MAREEQQKAEEEEAQKREDDRIERKKASRSLLGETIRREMAAKEATSLVPDIDDTDDLDPGAEFDAWRLRELSRLARDKEAAQIREDEREEIERRRALPEAQRLREDEEYARAQREEAREERGERGFMEKFWHKGAFHQVRRDVPLPSRMRTEISSSKIQRICYPVVGARTGRIHHAKKLQHQDRIIRRQKSLASCPPSPRFWQGEAETYRINPVLQCTDLSRSLFVPG